MLMFIAAVGFTACSDSDDDYKWATVSGEQVYFANTLPAKYDVSIEDSTLTIELSRVNTATALTADITIADTTGTYSIPSSVTFPAGSKTAEIVVSFDPTVWGYDNYVEATLSIANAALTSAYGATSYTFSAGIPSPYVSLGKGKFVEDFFFGFEQAVEIKQNQENTNVYRIYGAFDQVDDGNQSEYIELTLLQPGQTLFGSPVTLDGLVYWSPFNTGYHHSTYDADIMIYHPSKFTAYSTEDTWVLSKVLAYQEDGVTPGQIQLAPVYYMDGIGGWAAYSQSTEGMVIITFPGYAPKDYSLSAEFVSQGLNRDGVAEATFSITLGEDLQSVKYALVSGIARGAIDDVIDGVIASEEALESGTYSVPFTGNGRQTLVLVGYADGEPQTTALVTFVASTYAAQDTWKSLGVGLYTEEALLSIYGANPYTYEVEIQESETNPGIYRLVNAYGEAFPYNEDGDYDASRDYYIEVNAQDADAVYIPSQQTGLNWGDGEFIIQSLGSYFLDAGYSFTQLKTGGLMGTLKDGVITFPEDGLVATLLGTGMWRVGTGIASIVLPSAVPDAAPVAKAPVRKARRVAATSKTALSKSQLIRALPLDKAVKR